MERLMLMGVVLSLSFSCGGGNGDPDGGVDAGVEVDAGHNADAGSDAGVTKHEYDCTLHAICEWPDDVDHSGVDAGMRVISFILPNAACGGDAQSIEARDAGAFCVAFTDYFNVGIPHGSTCHACSLTDCVEQQAVCQ